jgi:hypothetical protein
VRGLGASSAPSITDEKGSHATLNADAHSSAPPKPSYLRARSSSPLPAALLLRVVLAGGVEEESVRLVRRCCARSSERGRSVQRASFKDASSSSSAGSSSCCRVSPARARESVGAGGGIDGEYSSCVCVCVCVCVCERERERERERECVRQCVCVSVYKGNHREDDEQGRQLTQHRSLPLPAHPRTLCTCTHARGTRSAAPLPPQLTAICVSCCFPCLLCVWCVRLGLWCVHGFCRKEPEQMYQKGQGLLRG